MHGLRISAPWLERSNPDVVIQLHQRESPMFDALERQLSANESDQHFCYRLISPSTTYLYWRDLLDVLVDAERGLLHVRELGAFGLDSFRSHLIGPVLSFVLLHRHVEVWHGGAITDGRHAIVLLGDSGAGKSTFAAAALSSGFRVITDDLVVFDRAADHFVIRPGPGRLKLFPAPAELLLGSGRESLPLNPFTGKRVFALHPAESWSEPTRVDAIVVLYGTAAEPEVAQLEGAAAIKALMANVFNSFDDSSARLERLLAQAAALCARVPAFTARMPDDLDRTRPNVQLALDLVKNALHSAERETQRSQQIVERL